MIAWWSPYVFAVCFGMIVGGACEAERQRARGWRFVWVPILLGVGMLLMTSVGLAMDIAPEWLFGLLTLVVLTTGATSLGGLCGVIARWRDWGLRAAYVSGALVAVGWVLIEWAFVA